MKRTATAINFFFYFSISSFSQMTFTDLASYCLKMSEASMPTLRARIEGLPRSKVEELMRGMTDPESIRMAKEVTEFAYSRPPNVGIDAMMTELRNMCLEKKILVQ
jgi:hypothetical protein